LGAKLEKMKANAGQKIEEGKFLVDWLLAGGVVLDLNRRKGDNYNNQVR
jgi:hypothetical protein